MKQSGRYDHKAGPLTASCKISNTIVAHVLRRFEFWLFLLLHAAVVAGWRMGYLKDFTDLSVQVLHVPWHEVGIITVVTALSEVIYVGRCYANHVRIHDSIRQMAGCVCDFAFRTRLCIRDAGHPHDQVACRLLVVSLVFFILEVRGFARAKSRASEPGESWVEEQDWQRLQDKKLLKANEAAFLQKLTCQQRVHFLLREAGRLANEGLKKARAPEEAAEDLAGALLAFRERQEQALESARLPVPFAYFHLLNVMVVINLFFWAFSLGMTASYLSTLFYVLSLAISLALLDLAVSLMQPFGDSREHLPMADWLDETLQNVNLMLNYRYIGASDSWVPKLQQEASSAGSLNLGRENIDGFLSGPDAT